MALRELSLVAPPSVLEVRPGDTIRVHAAFDYVGPVSPSAAIQLAMYTWTLADPHNIKAHTIIYKDIPLSPSPGNHIDAVGDIKLPTTGLPAGLLYGLFVVVKNVAGKDWYFYAGEKDPPYYKWIIEVTEVEPLITNLEIISYETL